MDRETFIGRYGIAGYQAAVGTAIVAGVFAVFVAVLLCVHLFHYSVTDPQAAAALEKMKEQAKAYPADQVLSEQVIALDAKLRRDQLARLQFLKRGTLLLMGTLTLCIGALIWSSGYGSKIALPGPRADLKIEQVAAARRIRAALTVSLATIAGLVLFWSLYTPRQIKAAKNAQDPAAGAADNQDVSFASMPEMQEQWPSFRGPQGLGVGSFKTVPAEWDAAGGKNIRWKTPVPVPGHSSPVVWNNRLFVTGADAGKQQVLCFDADRGEPLWTQDVEISDKTARADMNISEDTGYAASTPVTDGKRVCAIFAGGDIACFTADGRLLWHHSLGIPDSAYGFAASLSAFEDLVIVQWDVGAEAGQSKLIAFDWQTGDTRWQTPRPVPNSWSSPTVAQIEGAYRILTAALPFVIAYEPATGRELFRVECIDGDISATPIVAAGTIFTMEPYQKLVAIKASGASNDLTGSILWQTDGAMPDICSPVSDGVFVWTLDSGGELACYKASDGGKAYNVSLGLSFEASPTLVNSKLYLLSTTGTMVVAEASGDYREVGRYSLTEPCFASPAFAEGRIYIRASEHLYCIGAK